MDAIVHAATLQGAGGDMNDWRLWYGILGTAAILAAALGASLWLARRAMHKARDAARSAGFAVLDETWAARLNSFTGEVSYGGRRLRYVARVGSVAAYTRLQLTLPRPLTFSPFLGRGPLDFRFRGELYPQLHGVIRVGRDQVVPPEASHVVSQAVRARLGAHPFWAGSGLWFNAEHVQIVAANPALGTPEELREAASVLILFADHLLTIPSSGQHARAF